MEPEERLERFERVLEELREANRTTPIVVEGMRDIAALRELGLGGVVLAYNSRSILTLADDLRAHGSVIGLFDWDRKGGQLTELLARQLRGMTRFELDARRELARTSLVRCVEDLPAALRSLRRRVEGLRAERH